MNAVVTGGTGFIGSTLVENLVERGFEVTVIDNGLLGEAENLSDVENQIDYVEGSINDEFKLEETINEGVDFVFHLAALSSGMQHKQNPVKGIKTNVEGSYRVFNRCDTVGVGKVVYASTSSMYGSIEPPHHKDREGIEATNLYCASKMASEKYAEAVSKVSETDFVGLRIFSVYGEKEVSKQSLANVVSQFTWSIRDGERPTVFNDGSQRRDFIHVSDVVSAMVKSAKSGVNGSKVFDVGTGESHSMTTVVKLINKELGTDVNPEYVETTLDNYAEVTEAAPQEINEETGWVPEVSLEEGVSKVVSAYC